MEGLGHELRLLGAHKVEEGRSQHLDGLSRDNKLGVAGAQGMALGLGAQRMAHLEHLGPARKDKEVWRQAEEESQLSQDHAGSF